MAHSLLVGGLVAAGVDATGAFLLTISHSGRGVFSTTTWKRLARDSTPIYPVNGFSTGIGPLDGISVAVIEKDYASGLLKFSSPDAKLNFLYEDGVISISNAAEPVA